MIRIYSNRFVLLLIASLVVRSGGAVQAQESDQANEKGIVHIDNTDQPRQPISLDETSETQPAAPAAESSPEDGGGFLCWPNPASVKGCAISTDRPGFADSTSVAPRGHAQIELGYTYTADRDDGVRYHDHAIAQTNLRVGLLDNLELRTLWNGYSMTTSNFETSTPGGRTIRETGHDDGATDITLGLRSQLVHNKGWIPDLSVLGNISIPIGTNSKTVGDVVPDLRLAYGWALTDKMRLYGVGIVAAAVSDNERFCQTSASTGLSYALTSKLGSFVEYYGIYPARDGQDCAHSADGGFTYLINDNCQFDISAGIGLNDQAPDYLISAGISFRF